MNLELVQISGKKSGQQDESFNEGYKFWHGVWKTTFQELDGKSHLSSDNFSRQDEHLFLKAENQMIASISFRTVEASDPAAYNDSYFEAWPQEIKDKLFSLSSKIMIGSHITVHPEFRRNFQPFPLKFTVLALLIFRCVELEIDVITGTMRADKGMHVTSYGLSAHNLASDIQFHGVPVDLVAFRPMSDPPRFAPEQLAYLHKLWFSQERFQNVKFIDFSRKAA